MSGAGDATDLQNCAMCHVNSTEQNDLPPMGNLNQVTDPQGWINPVSPISSACSGCHVSKHEASHFLANTDALGESCSVCHASRRAVCGRRGARSIIVARDGSPILLNHAMARSGAQFCDSGGCSFRGSRPNASIRLRRLGHLQGLSRRYLQRARQEPASSARRWTPREDGWAASCEACHGPGQARRRDHPPITFAIQPSSRRGGRQDLSHLSPEPADPGRPPRKQPRQESDCLHRLPQSARERSAAGGSQGRGNQ